MAPSNSSSTLSQQDTPLQRALEGAVLQRLKLVDACAPISVPLAAGNWASETTATPDTPSISIDRPVDSPNTSVASRQRTDSVRTLPPAMGFPYLNACTIDVTENSTHQFWLGISSPQDNLSDAVTEAYNLALNEAIKYNFGFQEKLLY